MNEQLGLRVLGAVMNWDDERARNEFAWLRLIARLKYDSYRDFQAGMRFIESLATWLQQFKKGERAAAYEFIRHTLVYIGPAEMTHLVERFYPSVVQRRLAQTLARDLRIPAYRVLVEAADESKRLRRQTLFVGLSDGARLDTIRHMNTGILRNEQFLQSTQVGVDKWKDLLDDLRSNLGCSLARFRLIYLLDDFVGTGTTLLRFDKVQKKWKGKLVRFIDSIKRADESLENDRLLEADCELCIHHYVASSAAVDAVKNRCECAKSTIDERWKRRPNLSYGTILPPKLPINSSDEENKDFLHLTETYYDPQIRTRHTDVGGVSHLGLGYSGSALPLVLEHNTPNNSVALLWAETDGGIVDGVQTPAMRPLFRRRQRHF